MFKLAQGEYVSPERVEMVYAGSHLVNQIFLDGKSSESFAVAVCVPDMAALRAAMFPKKNGASNGTSGLTNGALKKSKDKPVTDEELCAKKEACVLILKDLIRLGKESGLKGFEQAKSIYLTPHEFTVDSGLLTPTQKKVRVVFRRTFREEIDRLYKDDMMIM